MSSLQVTNTANMASIPARRNKKGRTRKADADVHDLETVDESSPADEAADTISPEQAAEMRKRITQLESDLSHSRDENFKNKATIKKLTSEKNDLESQTFGWINPDDFPTRMDGSRERWNNEFELYRDFLDTEREKEEALEFINELCEENRQVVAENDELKGEVWAWNVNCMPRAKRLAADEVQLAEAKLIVVESHTKHIMETEKKTTRGTMP